MTSSKPIASQWILLRGLAREARHWDSFPKDLAKALSTDAGEARVEAIDIPGSGRYSEMTSPISIAGIANFVHDKYLEIRELQRRAGEKPASRTYVIAVSLGGMIAARWMQRWPQELAGGIFVNTSFRGISPLLQRLTPRAYLHIARSIALKDAVEREKEILRMISSRPADHVETAKVWATYALDRPVTAANFARQLIAAATFSFPTAAPACPILILNSARDRMVSPECSRQIEDRWSAPRVEHPTAGHDLPLDDPSWLIEQIHSFYAKA